MAPPRPRPALDWDDLRVVLAVQRAGSFAAAGRALRVDRVTVMRRLDALEASLGARLFDRARDGCTLTAAGERLLPAVHDVEGAIAALDRAVGGGDASLEGAVRVTLPEWLALGLIAPELPRLRARYPGLALELITTNQLLSLVRREADVAIRNVRPTQRNLVQQSIGPFAFALYAAHTYLAERGAPSGRWAGHDLVIFDDELSYMPGQRWLMQHASDARVAMRATEVMPLCAAARAGAGVAALPCLLGDADPSLARVAPGVIASFDVWMVVHPDLRRAARVRAVVDHLSGVFAAHRPALQGSVAPRKRARRRGGTLAP